MIERVTMWLRSRLLAERDAAGIVALRVLFGLIGFVSALRFLHYGWVDDLFVKPKFHFKYWFAPFIEPLGASGTHAVFWTIAASSACVALGLFYRAAIATFLVSFTYVQLIDVTNYLNHYYLLNLLALLMVFMPLGDRYGVDGWLRSRLRGTRAATSVPAWCYVVARFQVGVVYTFAGVAKLTEDWLVHAQPLDIWLASRTTLPVIGPALAQPWAPHLMSWAGCLFDLTIVIWLSWRRTRPFAFVAVLAFHALTKWLFPIGMFPFIMVAAATVFFDPSWPRRFLRSKWACVPVAHARPSRWFGVATAAFGLYACVQVLVPLRAFAYGGDVHWHEHGMRFSWRVMVREKNASVTYLVDDPKTGRTVEIAPRRYLDARQEREFATQPDLVAQLARHIARERSTDLGAPVRVRAEVLASLNGRRSKLLIDPEVDLAATEDGLAPSTWVLSAPKGRPPFLHASR
ncbi:MAG: HTTM domain-containing protein [Polyangiaceae bacterium]|nr:HTTM domain-containing protein [Polyangiaceae bacterium]